MPRRRDISIARIFFSDSPESKMRPCVILSSDKYNKTGFVLAASITTSPDEYCLPFSQNDCDCALEKSSAARFDGIIRLHQKHLIKPIGKVSTEFYLRLVQKIMDSIVPQ